MPEYVPIECGHYDILEIACMDRYEIELTLDDGCVQGVAEQLETRNREEFLWVKNKQGHKEAIRVDRIQSMSVMSRPARFVFHDFGQG